MSTPGPVNHHLSPGLPQPGASFCPPPCTPFERFLKTPSIRLAVKIALDALAALVVLLVIKYLLMNVCYPGWLDLGWLLGITAIAIAFRSSRQHYRAFGLRDITFILLSLLASASLLILVFWLIPGSQRPLSVVYLVATPLAHLAWISIRMLFLLVHDRAEIFGGNGFSKSRPALIIGGGRAGLLVAQELKRHPELGARVVGFLDDAMEKQGVRIQGIPVLGTTELLPALLDHHGIGLVILAIPTAPGSLLRRLADAAKAKHVPVKTVPGMFRQLEGQRWKPGLQDLSIEDLLRREPIQLDHTLLGERLRDSVVLITGAGGSIGSEIARQVAAFGPSRLVLLGRGEGSLWDSEQNLRALFPGLPLAIELCDIRNERRLDQVFRRWKPQVVFHAAAHKHVPYLEEHPEEAVENNVFGTRNVVEAALAARVPVFVNISTDKAINPTNVLGASKYLAERLVLKGSFEAPKGARYVSVRFGNVLGSRGSVIPIFQRQIQAGGPLTVTHKDMERYFMTIPEASQLVLQAGLLGENGRVYVLDMGEPVRIVDLAIDVARLAGFTLGMDLELRFTGLRPGEKLFEELFNGHETECPSIHPKVREAHLKVLDPEVLATALDNLHRALDTKVDSRRRAIAKTFVTLIPGYQPSKEGIGRYLHSEWISTRNELPEAKPSIDSKSCSSVITRFKSNQQR
jgi:FlaA1/EpsC-like NDP-sugar epimerase